MPILKAACPEPHFCEAKKAPLTATNCKLLLLLLLSLLLLFFAVVVVAAVSRLYLREARRDSGVP